MWYESKHFLLEREMKKVWRACHHMMFCNFYFCKEIRSRVFMPSELHRKTQRRGFLLLFLFSLFSLKHMYFLHCNIGKPLSALVCFVCWSICLENLFSALPLNGSFLPFMSHTSCEKPLRAELGVLLFVPIASFIYFSPCHTVSFWPVGLSVLPPKL